MKILCNDIQCKLAMSSLDQCRFCDDNGDLTKCDYCELYGPHLRHHQCLRILSMAPLANIQPNHHHFSWTAKVNHFFDGWTLHIFNHNISFFSLFLVVPDLQFSLPTNQCDYHPLISSIIPEGLLRFIHAHPSCIEKRF